MFWLFVERRINWIERFSRCLSLVVSPFPSILAVLAHFLHTCCFSLFLSFSPCVFPFSPSVISSPSFLVFLFPLVLVSLYVFSLIPVSLSVLPLPPFLVLDVFLITSSFSFSFQHSILCIHLWYEKLPLFLLFLAPI